MSFFVSTLLNPIFPICAVMLVGIFFAKCKLFDAVNAQAVNKFVFYVAMPALILGLLTNTDFSGMNLRLPLVYFLCEAVIFACTTLISRYLLKRSLAESLLLAMAACFVNHAFFVLPIASILYGEDAARLITIIIVDDTIVLFGGMTVVMELLHNRQESRINTVKKLITNPVIIAIFMGCLVNFLHIDLHEGFHTYTDFVGKAAAPASMFALGIIIAANIGRHLDICALSITSLKLILFPLLIWIAIAWLQLPEGVSKDTLMLTSAGPCGAMPFVLAVQYRVNPDSIGLAIVYSTLLSLLTLALAS